jgi:hypothetical protein
VAKIRAVFDEQKTARREQQQVLSTLVQDTTQLLTLHREYKRVLDDSYLFVLTRMFWLRDAKALDWNTLQDMLHGATSTARRLQAFVQAIRVGLQTTWQGALHLWFLAFLVVLVLPWGICKAGRVLRHWQMAAQATATPSLPAEIGVAAVLVLRTLLCPGYVLLFAHLLGYVLPQGPTHKALSVALVSGLQMSALTLGAGLLGGTMLQPHGWGQRFWGLNPALCRFLRLLVLVTCIAVLLFLVPRQMLLTAPGDGEVTAGSLALARFFFLAFQSVVVLVWLLGRRNSPLMDTILARSREHDGLLWRIWPFVHLLLLAGVLGIVVLDVLGYRYAARFIWSV